MKVSVALCTYNGERFLTEQLESIMNQTYPVSEVVVCDDKSIDKTFKILENFVERYPRVFKIIRNDTNLGGKHNFEKAFSLTTGDVIFFSDQDDTWRPDKVKEVVKTLERNPGCLGVFSDGNLVDERGESLGCSFWESLTLDEVERKNLKDGDICFYILNYVNMVAGSMLAVLKEAKPILLPFKFMDKIWHDQYIALVLSSMKKLTCINDSLINYRQHSGQLIGAGSLDFQRKVSSFKMLESSDYQRENSLLYFNHSWDTYERVKLFVQEFDSFKTLIPFYRQRALHSRTLLLKNKPFLIRKARVCKWFFMRRFETNFIDVVFF